MSFKKRMQLVLLRKYAGVSGIDRGSRSCHAGFHIPHLLAEGPLKEKKNSRQWMRMEIFLCTPVGREFQKCNSGSGNRSGA
jgi:hypothetical protein